MESAIALRSEIIRAHRPRGIYVPALDVPLHLANGWKLLDDCPGSDDVLLSPPFAPHDARGPAS